MNDQNCNDKKRMSHDDVVGRRMLSTMTTDGPVAWRHTRHWGVHRTRQYPDPTAAEQMLMTSLATGSRWRWRRMDATRSRVKTHSTLGGAQDTAVSRPDRSGADVDDVTARQPRDQTSLPLVSTPAGDREIRRGI